MTDSPVPLRLALGEAAFRDLVAGRVVQLMTTTNQPVELILSDIGWERMLYAVDDAHRRRHAAVRRMGQNPRWAPR